MFDTITNRANPRAASQAANTSRMIGIMLSKVKCEFKIVRAARINSDNIMPSKQSSEYIRWDQHISKPIRDIVKAMIMFICTRDTW